MGRMRVKSDVYTRARRIALTLLLIGAAALVSAVVSVSSILALIGLGLSFWGALFLFIKPVSYMRRELLASTTVSSLSAINRILTNLGYLGKGLYLPPASLKGFKEGVVFISKNAEIAIPPADQVLQEKFFANQHGIYLTPLGQGLVNLFETKLGTDFSKTNFEYLQATLPKLLIEDLEILEGFEMSIEGDIVSVEMIKSIYTDLCRELEKASNICSQIGCPLCSSIACALAKAIGKAVVIERNELIDKDKTIKTWYRLIGD